MFSTQASDIMAMPTIVPATVDEAGLVCANLRGFNAAIIGKMEFMPLYLAAKDPGGAVVGGIVAEVALGWLEIQVLWVAGHARGDGLGSGLLHACEARAAALGARSSRLDTFDWQAEDFYKRHGYEVFACLDDYPPGRKRLFMSKRLDCSSTGRRENG